MRRNWNVFLRNWKNYLLALLAAIVIALAIIGMAASLELYASLQLTIAEKRLDLKQAIVLLNGSFEVNEVAMWRMENDKKLLGE